uniref:Uncharacterized protein n=1 Tax=Anopheles atroparvus TaxID=41427 RepID=A0A182INS9_ANOAO
MNLNSDKFESWLQICIFPYTQHSHLGDETDDAHKNAQDINHPNDQQIARAHFVHAHNTWRVLPSVVLSFAQRGEIVQLPFDERTRVPLHQGAYRRIERRLRIQLRLVARGGYERDHQRLVARNQDDAEQQEQTDDALLERPMELVRRSVDDGHQDLESDQHHTVAPQGLAEAGQHQRHHANRYPEGDPAEDVIRIEQYPEHGQG